MPISAIMIYILIMSVLVLSAYLRIKDRNSTSVDDNNDSYSITERSENATIIRTYTGENRYIDGHMCNSYDDMQRWYVKKGLSEGYERRLSEIETSLSKLNTDGGEELFEEWNARYLKYRELCIIHGIWNHVIRDRGTFYPTEEQLMMEEKRKKEITQLLQNWRVRMDENQAILDYLNKSPRKHASKKKMIEDLSGGDKERRKEILIIYRRLVKDKVIADKESENGEVITRIVLHKKKTQIKPFPPSKYIPEIYSDICKKDLYKVDYTVEEPIDLDFENNTCFFKSKTSGEVYRTSLEKCSCPAFQKGHACKHMLALALELGYYQRWMVS